MVKRLLKFGKEKEVLEARDYINDTSFLPHIKMGPIS
jgi:hypothetical protein